MIKDLNAPSDEDGDVAAYQEQYPEQVDVTLLTSIIHEYLREIDGGDRKSMQCEYQVLISYL